MGKPTDTLENHPTQTLAEGDELKTPNCSMNIEFLAGTKIEDACAEAIHIATTLRAVVRFDFNGVQVCAKPNDDPNILACVQQHEQNRKLTRPMDQRVA